MPSVPLCDRNNFSRIATRLGFEPDNLKRSCHGCTRVRRRIGDGQMRAFLTCVVEDATTDVDENDLLCARPLAAHQAGP